MFEAMDSSAIQQLYKWCEGKAYVSITRVQSYTGKYNEPSVLLQVRKQMIFFPI